MQVRNTSWPRFYAFWLTWNRFWLLYHLWVRVEDLERLSVWAKRKRLSGPYRSYCRSQTETEMRLHTYAIRSPRLNNWAWILYRTQKVLAPPRRYRKGAAAQYRAKAVYTKPKFAIM